MTRKSKIETLTLIDKSKSRNTEHIVISFKKVEGYNTYERDFDLYGAASSIQREAIKFIKEISREI